MASLHYVYLLVSESRPDVHYTGFTHNLSVRLNSHNSGQVPHTAKYKPWRVDVFVAFSARRRALAFEKYLKSHSGRAFAKTHF
jgi:predicted GIY-YIG superfamily endonuclease